ncbi:MAG TPA: PAS domain S-box protein [Opitutus sp.]|nr:PAS domain S-box protein [Opitutus sp.]
MDKSQPNSGSGAAPVSLERVLDSMTDAFVTIDRTWRFSYVSARAAEIFGQPAAAVAGRQVWAAFPEGEKPFRAVLERALAEQMPVELEEFYAPFDRWLEIRVQPSPDGLAIFFRDISARKTAEALLGGQKAILEMVAIGRPLAETLDTLLRFIEGQSPDMLGSILLLDRDGVHVRHGAAPRLPEAFIRAIDGATIGPKAGSCGTAAYRREAVFVADIAADPLWDDYRRFALPHGLRACWSTPIFDPEHRVLGTFAIYYRQTGLPNGRHRELIEFTTHTAAICIGRERAEAALRESEARYALAVRGTADGLWDWNVRTNADYLSPRWKELLGFADHELPNHANSFFERLHPDDVALAREAVKAHLERKTPYDIELRLRHKSGEYRWYRSRGQAEWDADGQPVRMAGAIADITARKAAEMALRDAAEFNRQVIGGAKEGVVVLDRELRYTLWNPFMEELLGIKAGEVLGRHPAELFAWVREGGQLAALERALAGESIVLPDSQRLNTGAQRTIWIQTRMAPLRNGHGGIAGVIATVTDVTERHRAEEMLRSSHEQLRALTGRLQSIREEQSARIAREIHDVLGQQLTALKLDLAWLKRRCAAVNPAEGEPIRDKITGTMELVDATIGTVQKVATELRPGLLDKLGLGAALEHEAREFAGRAGLRCATEIGDVPAQFEAKRAIEVFRICQELLTNVARHARASGFALRMGGRDGELVLTVADDGCGITTQQISGARSLGVLGMRERAALLGGTLDFAGVPGKGTTATLKIPLQSAA